MIDSLHTGQAGILSDGAVWRSLGMLMLVLVLLIASVWFLRRLQRGTSVRSLDLEVLGRLPIAQKQFLSVVRVGKDLWVLGVSDGSIQYLGDYQGELPAAKAAAPSGFSFGALLESKLKGPAQRRAVNPEVAS
jgi:flagellar biosynthetic protein FliO